MTSMWKRMVKGNRDRSSKDYSNAQGHDRFRTPAGTAPAVEYDRAPPGISSFSSSTTAPAVEYDRSPPDLSYLSTTSAVPVEYDIIRPDVDPYMSQPSPRGHTYGSPALYNPQPPSGVPNTGRENQGTYAPVQYQSNVLSPAAVDYSRYPPPVQPPYSHEFGPPKSPPMVSYGQSPANGYASINAQMQPPPQLPQQVQQPQPHPQFQTQAGGQQYPSYGNTGENVATQRPPYNYQEHNAAPSVGSSTPKYIQQNEAQKSQHHFENAYPESVDSGASSLYNPPYSTVSNSTTPTSVYSPDRPNFQAPPLPPRNQQATSDSTATPPDDPNVSKFVVRLFCQRKRGEGDTHEETPRDIREFRLANLALIKLAAGGERYVLLDAVFGELDQAIAPLLEKHWYLTLNTTVEEHFVPGGKNVVAIGKIMVAYKGTQSTLYADFKKDEDFARFKMEMEYAMNTIRNGNPKLIQSEKEFEHRYRY